MDDLFENEKNLKTLYVNRRVVNYPEIVNWAYKSGFKYTLDPIDFHVTIAYSKTKFDWNSTTPLMENLTLRGGDRSMKHFQGGAVVLTLQNDTLTQRWQQFLDLGATNKFPEYKPHITITYTNLPARVLAFPGDIIFGPENWSEINDDWKANMSERPTGA